MDARSAITAQRADPLETALVLTVVFGYSAAVGFGWAAELAGAVAVLVTLAALALAAGRLDSAPGLTVATLGLLLAASSAVAWLWPLPPLLAVAAFVAVARLRGRGRLMLTWLRRGRLDAGSWALVGATVAVSAAAVGIWALAADSDAAGVRESLAGLRALPAWAWPLVGLAFAAVNAGAEEAVYRGVFQEGITAVVGAVPAVALQATAFGILHYGGFPRGVAGVGLATVYGVLLGALRLRSSGLLAPWLAHTAADVVTVALALVLLA